MSKYCERYLELCHSMQAGVAAKMGFDTTDVQPKHLRVGINTALCDQAALALLLMDKGIITEEEYEQALATVMEREVERYKATVAQHFGIPPDKVTLV